MSWIVFVAVLSFLANYCQGSNELKRNKLIIDTDAGSDDAVALLLALAVPEVEVLAIICTYGNTWLYNVEKNVLKTLTIANQSRIPVYSGADKPLYENFTASEYFGKDGMNDFKFDKEVVANIDRSKHAALAMIDLVKQYPGEVSIVTLGPLTNVALALSLDSNFSRNVKRFYAMGASPDRKGYNVVLDPESNAIFLKAPTTKTKIIMSSNVTTTSAIKKGRTETLGTRRSSRIQFANDAESKTLENERIWRIADMITVATFIWPKLVVNSMVAQMSSATCNEDRGSVKLDDYGGNNVELVTDFDKEGLKEKLLQYFV